jgi:hypothetical protein
VSAKDFIPFETVGVGLEFRNTQAAGRAVESKVWIERGDGFLVSAINLGADGGQTLAGGQVVSFPQSPLFTVDPSMPLGTWAVGCRLLDPITGETLVEDRDTFTVLATR